MVYVSVEAKPKKQTVPPALFSKARYVYVEATDGDAFTPGLLPEDRQAIFDVQDGLRRWNRYALTERRSQADLVFVVRKGRIASADAHVGISVGNHPANSGVSPGNTSQQENNAGAGVEVGPPDDLLDIYTLDPQGRLSGPIWMKSEADGLRSPGLPLFTEIESAVDSAYPLK
jgi:hypothetical protein